MSDILLHGKAQKPLLLKTMPAHNIGFDGNFAISTITGKGVFLSAKTNGRWFSAGKMEELKTFDNKTIDNISTKILKVRKEISMGDSFKLNSNSLSVSTGDFAINSNENVLLNSDTAIDGNLDISGIQTITSKTKLTNGLMSNPHLNLKYDDKNYVKFGTIKSGGLQIEPYKVDDVSGVTVGPIKLMYDETYYTTFQNDSSGNFTLASTGNATLDVAGDIVLNADGGQVTIKDDTRSHFLFDCDQTTFTIYDDTDAADYFRITVSASGQATIGTVDDGATIGHLLLRPDGNLVLEPTSGKILINAIDGLYFDGDNLSPHTYIYEAANDVMRVNVGGDTMMQLSEKGDGGNEVSFGSSCAGFTQIEPTYDATTTIVDFRHSNKQFLTFGSGDITNVVLTFPLVSGNFVLLVKQDGTGSRTITNWKAAEFDESAADGEPAVKWAGGSAPTLTTDANHVDILSFYWDADNEIAYGVATLDFQF